MGGCIALTDEEIVSVCNYFDNLGRDTDKQDLALRNKTMFLTGIFTGLRVGSLSKIKVRDVYQYGKINNVLAVEKRNTKGKRTGQNIDIIDDLKKLIMEYVKHYHLEDSEGYLFTSMKGGPNDESFGGGIGTRQILHIYKTAYEACGIGAGKNRLGTHTTRKSYAKRIHALGGNDIQKTQLALGHSSLNSTQHYLETNPEEVSAAMKLFKVEGLMSPVGKYTSVRSTSTE
jgi:integrase/recombinase XerD